jgi:aquaporin Z
MILARASSISFVQPRRRLDVSRLGWHCHLVAIPVTNTSVSPARSTGTALFAGPEYIGQLWLFGWRPHRRVVAGRALFEPVDAVETVIMEER